MLNTIKLDHEFINRYYYKKKLRDMKVKNKVQYKQFSSITGRLSVTPSSFPIMTLDKELRDVVLPTNDWILEIDYNAAELRVFLGLSGHDQPQGDLHKWNSTFLKTDRQHAKRSVIAYMYGSKNYDVGELEKLYNVKSVKEKHFNPEREEIVNLYGRKIKSDEFHAVNYTIQSTAAEIALRNTLKIYHLLKDRKSSVKFCLHDSIVIDSYGSVPFHLLVFDSVPLCSNPRGSTTLGLDSSGFGSLALDIVGFDSFVLDCYAFDSFGFGSFAFNSV